MLVIRVLPDPPSTTDPLNFASKADAHVLALQDFTTDVNNFAAQLQAVGVIAPSLDTIAANATTTQLWNYSHIQNWTGTPTITDLPDAPQAGANRVVYPAAGTVFTNNSNLSVQGGANYTVEAGDKITIYAKTISTFDVFIERKNGKSIYQSFVGYKLVSASRALTSDDLGALIMNNGTGVVLTVPQSSSLVGIRSGDTFNITNYGSNTCQVAFESGVTWTHVYAYRTDNIVIDAGKSLTLVYEVVGGNGWIVFASTAV